MEPVYVATAGWSLSAETSRLCPGEGSHLERYARSLPAVEVNSRFYRPHQAKTWLRWAQSTPPGFRFAVKVPKAVSHEARLKDLSALTPFLAEVDLLEERLGPLLLQLPPSLAFDADDAERVLAALAGHTVVLEPRHPSWFDAAVDAFLAERQVARVAADPAPVPAAAEPGGFAGRRYWRLHGSPQMYHSPYSAAFLDVLAERLRPGDWCVFDNTASGQALKNASALLAQLAQKLGQAESQTATRSRQAAKESRKSAEPSIAASGT